MTFKELNIEEFTNFQKNHPLSNFYQTINYALLMAENGFEYDLVGLVDEYDNILAASLILLKPIGIKCFYGYAPRGFLIDYSNEYLVNKFTEALKEYYYNKNVIFIKLNPNLPISEIDNKTFDVTYNSNKEIAFTLNRYNYKKLKNNLYFESQLPRFNAFINLKTFNVNNLDKNTKNKIKKGIRKGLVIDRYPKEYIGEFYKLMQKKKDNTEYYYQDYYTVFDKNDSVDLFLVSIDYNEFLQNSQYVYNAELEKNNKLNEKLARSNSEHTINTKMNSDKILLSYKNDIMEATKGISDNKQVFIAGALVIKHNNSVNIVFSGYDQNYKRFAPNYFLHYSLIKYYKDNYDYLDLNGMVGNFTEENPYSGLNRFKLGFNPQVYEYIGEFDLIVEPKSYDILLSNGILAKEFNKKDIKK
ncbi:MAG: peptidoglycan bridge formation glycyltransferase FemA/FemB family protein [Bacilli bacterium]|nr:peptidoglycan bridge formation glycyltransferase FemA/FemB family protein [Bacilli bacterium]